MNSFRSGVSFSRTLTTSRCPSMVFTRVHVADIGMEAIHPKASKPLEVAGINIRIKNTFEPEHPGTLISNEYVGEESRVEIISGTDQVTALEVHDPFMVGQVGYDMNLMKVMQRYHVSYILKATNANSITMVIWETNIDSEAKLGLPQVHFN